jgi:hypothetical protein
MFLPKSKLTWFDASRRQRDIAPAAAVIPASLCRAWWILSSMGVAELVAAAAESACRLE